MKTNTSLQERASEHRAGAEAAIIVRILQDLALEPSTKRFNRSRAARIERWDQLAKVAYQQACGLRALSEPAPEPAPAPTVVADN